MIIYGSGNFHKSILMRTHDKYVSFRCTNFEVKLVDLEHQLKFTSSYATKQPEQSSFSITLEGSKAQALEKLGSSNTQSMSPNNYNEFQKLLRDKQDLIDSLQVE
jgi:hypothetical protein